MHTFNAICILAAGLLAASCIPRYKYIALAVFIEFALHAVVYSFGMQDTKILNKWAIYGGYLIFQIPIIYYLFFIKSHIAISLLISLNAVINVCGWYFGYKYWEQGYFETTFRLIYALYPWIIGMIMILELLFLGWLRGYIRLHTDKHGNTNYDYIDSVLCVSRGSSKLSTR